MNIHNIDVLGIDSEGAGLTSIVRSSTKVDTSGGWNAGWKHEAIYTYEDGTTIALKGTSVDHVAIPAQPGFELLTFDLAGGDFADMDPDTIEIAKNIRRHPVIGWVICYQHGDSWAEAITEADGYGNTSSHGFKAISGPNGYFRWQHNSYMLTATEPRDIDQWADAIRAELHHRKKAATAKREARGGCPTCGHVHRDDVFGDDLPL